jgi:hypothetical protein
MRTKCFIKVSNVVNITKINLRIFEAIDKDFDNNVILTLKTNMYICKVTKFNYYKK